MTVKGLTGEMTSDVSFDLYHGEILGLTGLLGMGHEEVPYLMAGAHLATSGEIAVEGQSVAAEAMTPRTARALRLAFLPGDRQNESGVIDATVLENATLPLVSHFFHGGRLRHDEERSYVNEFLARFEVRPNDPFSLLLSALSGGISRRCCWESGCSSSPSSSCCMSRPRESTSDRAATCSTSSRRWRPRVRGL